eukprot:22538-Chlamydomonas_euryale.AAC.1
MPRGRRGTYVRACLRPKVGQGRGRHDRPRPEAERTMFCARMTLPRFHMRVDTSTACMQHRRDLRSKKCIHKRVHMDQHACCILLCCESYANYANYANYASYANYAKWKVAQNSNL